MVIDTTKERRRRIFANILHKKMSPTRMLIDKIRHVVNESRDENQGTLGRLFLD